MGYNNDVLGQISATRDRHESKSVCHWRRTIAAHIGATVFSVIGMSCAGYGFMEQNVNAIYGGAVSAGAAVLLFGVAYYQSSMANTEAARATSLEQTFAQERLRRGAPTRYDTSVQITPASSACGPTRPL